MVYQIHKKRKATGEGGKEIHMPFVDAVFWAAVEPQDADFTEEFIKATAVPYEKRSAREHEVINIYWRLGLSLDPVLNFMTPEVTQKQVESRLYGVTWSGVGVPKLPEILNGADWPQKNLLSTRKIPQCVPGLDPTDQPNQRHKQVHEKVPLSGPGF